MAELNCKPVRHDHAAFLAKARLRKGFAEAYDALDRKYQLANELLRDAADKISTMATPTRKSRTTR